MNPDQSPIGERRGRLLAPLQTNFSRPAAQKRSQRPRPTEYPSINGSEGPIPLQGPVKRQSSKTSLRSLFGHKPLRADSKLEEIVEAQPEPQTAILLETTLSPSILSPQIIDSNLTNTSPTERSRTTSRSSRLKTAPKHTNQEQYGWKSPPLFQAYPQSIKHACLPAPALTADSILRLHVTSARSSTDDNPANLLEQSEAADAARKKREQKQRKHLRTVSGTINKVEWTQKIYVLSTTGCILQYAGEGKHDRLPERMLLLGPKSVAFASDAIPGKHWVVQVSHNPTADGSAVPEPPRPRFSRFGFHRPNARRFSHNFLLVLENPDDMIGWLVAVRAEIEKRGGRKFTQEKQLDEDTMPQLQSKSSVRQMVKKDPHRISSLFLQPQTLLSPTEEEDGQSVGATSWQSRRSSCVSVNRRSVIDSRSGSVSTVRTEATNATNRSASIGSDMRSSSFTSSNIPHSPPIGTGAFRPGEPVPEELDRIYTRSPPVSSLHTPLPPQPPPITEFIEEPQVDHSLSVAEALIRCTSPPAPNFSVPSFSKKFVPRSGTTPIPHASPPSSINGFARRTETDPNMSTLASPSQTPTFSVASLRHADSTEARRRLRPSNSEDALTKTVRSTQNIQLFYRPPITAPPTGPLPDPRASSRPLSLMDGSSMSRKPINITQVQPAPPPKDPIPRQRVSAVYPDNQAAQSMLRRKSMPGLGLIGPPSAPPPNCPLPKLPSPAPSIANTSTPASSTDTTASHMLSAWSVTSPMQRFYGSEPVRDHLEDRKSGAHSASNDPARDAPQNARHSKLIKSPLV
ncbi:Peptidase family M20/M25/M40 protein [Penicillium digitatum]|uniref:Peptidase family M20/M25/M40 protein n=3 Tax=Penicillium digitatum TaxID=36651 RepID=K9F8J5_PEND2|nr:Peptidase family M20/M25/M40 protein [Penicillium digitatum Pd1]EKV04086.1 Peptidase family M20/M25/M40 protein [Penicillium digitatum Pd1]EKV05429.1 Peptidase family M20/M25/M40 protein [Penicillium digitatum PHI26]QQK45148.1 Peptidase family M20/M25/M40 protein [Penicillium digitatum]